MHLILCTSCEVNNFSSIEIGRRLDAINKSAISSLSVVCGVVVLWCCGGCSWLKSTHTHKHTALDFASTGRFSVENVIVLAYFFFFRVNNISPQFSIFETICTAANDENRFAFLLIRASDWVRFGFDAEWLPLFF